MISPGQIKKIHVLKNALGWTDEEYRAFLMERGEGFASSCKDLSHEEAGKIIEAMETEAIEKGIWEKSPSYPHLSKGDEGGFKRKYDELGDRKGMASPKQLRMIEAMWAGVSYHKDPRAREKALKWFIVRICGVQKLEWLEQRHVHQVIWAIEKMKGERS